MFSSEGLMTDDVNIRYSMAAKIFGVSHVPTRLAEIEISSMWSLVTALAQLIKMVQYFGAETKGIRGLRMEFSYF